MVLQIGGKVKPRIIIKRAGGSARMVEPEALEVLGALVRVGTKEFRHKKCTLLK